MEAGGALDNSGNLSGNEDVVSLSDIIPETNICFVSLNDEITHLQLKMIYGFTMKAATDISFIFTVKKKKNRRKWHLKTRTFLVRRAEEDKESESHIHHGPSGAPVFSPMQYMLGMLDEAARGCGGCDNEESRGGKSRRLWAVGFPRHQHSLCALIWPPVSQTPPVFHIHLEKKNLWQQYIYQTNISCCSDMTNKRISCIL